MFSKDAQDLIRRLLTRADKRIGASDIQEIKNHPFFEVGQWRSLEPHHALHRASTGRICADSHRQSCPK